MKRALLVFVLLVTVVTAQEQGASGLVPGRPLPAKDFTGSPTYKVVRVVDGDTVVLLVDGKKTTVRLIGVDTPETVDPRKPVQAYGKEASQFLTNLLSGEEVYLEYELGPSKLDKYGRTLAYLYRVPDGLFVNAEIVRQGYGHAYVVFPFQHMELFRSYEQRAREAGKGLWASPGLTSPEAAPASPLAQPQPKSELQAPQQPPPVRDQGEEVIVYGTATGTKYHQAGCRFLARSSIPMSLKDAKARGLTPCSVCNPPR